MGSNEAVRTKDMNPLIQPRRDPLSEGEELEIMEPENQVSLLPWTGWHRLWRSSPRRRRKAGPRFGWWIFKFSRAPFAGDGQEGCCGETSLRVSYQDCPEEISALIEKLMYEDLNNMTMLPGMTSMKSINARSWVEFRSRYTHKTSAYASWGVAGILDSMIAGDFKKAQARAGVYC